MRIPAFCICKKRRRSAVRSPRTYQRLSFCYIDSSVLLLPKSVISSLYPSVTVQPGLYQTLPETLRFSQVHNISSSHFVSMTFGRIRLLVNVTFRQVCHSVEKIARYDIPSQWSAQLFYNKTLKKSISRSPHNIFTNCIRCVELSWDNFSLWYTAL